MERLELPTFWDKKVELWFAAVESQFISRRITSDSTRYHAVVAKLNQDVLSVVEHIIAQPPASDRYKAIKAALLNHFCVSQEKQFRTLISGLELSSRRPSDLLAEMNRLGGHNMDPKFIRTLWMDRLPAHVQVALTAADGLALGAMASLADRIMEIPTDASLARVMPLSMTDPVQTNHIAAIAHPDSRLEQRLSDLSERVDELARTVTNLQGRGRSKSKRGRSRSNTPRPAHNNSEGSRNSPDGEICYYHRRFGNKADKCTIPCAWQSGGSGNENSRQ